MLCLSTDAVQVLVSADEELAVVDGGGGVGFFGDFVLGDDVEGFAGFDDSHVAFVGEEVGEAIGGKEGGAVAAGKTFHPVPLAGFGVEATGHSVVGDDQKVGANGDG